MSLYVDLIALALSTVAVALGLIQRSPARYSADLAAAARHVLKESMGDYEALKAELAQLITRVDQLEAENVALSAYVMHDEMWHADLNTRHEHLRFAEFIEQWNAGWRPNV